MNLNFLSNYPGVYMVVVFLVILSSTLWLFLGIFLNDVNIIVRLVMIVVGCMALLVMPCRDIYLPFLGNTVLPSSILVDTEPQGTVAVELVNLPPNAKVVFWAAKEGQANGYEESPQQAYENYVNGGIATSNERGIALITLCCPQQYTLTRFGIDRKLPRHVHFRYELKDRPGFFSRIETKEISC